jgi:arginine exporter protein ArgO
MRARFFFWPILALSLTWYNPKIYVDFPVSLRVGGSCQALASHNQQVFVPCVEFVTVFQPYRSPC